MRKILFYFLSEYRLINQYYLKVWKYRSILSKCNLCFVVFGKLFPLFVLCCRWSTRAAWVTWPAEAYHVSASWAACGRAGVRPPASLSTADPRRSFSTAASSSPADGQPTAPRFATLAARTITFPATRYAGKDSRDGNNVKNERTNIPISNETKTFRSRIRHVENRLFRFGPESALLDQKEMIWSLSMEQIRERNQTFWFHSC